jgi:hypothetical protein
VEGTMSTVKYSTLVTRCLNRAESKVWMDALYNDKIF